MMINNLKARKMLMKGWSEYLAHVVSKLEEIALRLQSTLVMCKFPYIFLDELPRLALRITPILKALYRMILVDFKKLKK